MIVLTNNCPSLLLFGDYFNLILLLIGYFLMCIGVMCIGEWCYVYCINCISMTRILPLKNHDQSSCCSILFCVIIAAREIIFIIHSSYPRSSSRAVGRRPASNTASNFPLPPHSLFILYNHLLSLFCRFV